MGLMISEVYVNVTRSCRYGESGIYESFADTTGELFKSCRKEHGKCVSKVYIDTKNGTRQIGWVFQKKRRYDDTNEEYLAEVWVTLE